jgi:hypothetical protein
VPQKIRGALPHLTGERSLPALCRCIEAGALHLPHREGKLGQWRQRFGRLRRVKQQKLQQLLT